MSFVRSSVRVLLPLSLAALGACAEDGTLTTLKPKIVLTPDAGSTLEFDEVILTRTEVGPKVIAVANMGSGPLQIEGIDLTGSGAEQFRVSSFPKVLAPSQENEIFIRFEPSIPGSFTVTLDVRSNDPEKPKQSFTIKGSAREPCILYADQSRMLFSVGDKKQLTISSLSSHDCTIDRVFTDTAVFPVRDMPAVPFVIPARKSMAVTIEHLPVSASARGIPVRSLQVRESEGSEVDVMLEGEPPLFGCLSLFPNELIFAKTEVGQTKRQRTTVSNRCGKAAGIVSAAMFNGYDVFALDRVNYPVVVPAGGSTDVWITYAPQATTTLLNDYGTLVINTNDSGNPRFEVKMSGTSAVPAIEYFPRSLDFGSVIYRSMGPAGTASECSSAVRYVQIYNTGEAPLRVSRMEVAMDRDQRFAVTSVVVNGVPVQNFNQPWSIRDGESAQIAIQFSPTRTAPAIHDGVLRIHHNADTIPAEISLRGNSVPDGSVTDRFTQLAGPKVDILWVIDDSCSMGDEQARLIQNLSQFIGYADSVNSDYQMAVIDTDARSSRAGEFHFCYPHPRIIRNNYVDRERAFRCLFNVGLQGSGIEAGIGASMRALERAQLPFDPNFRNVNSGFIRPDANLAIVALSDEEDQSDESDDLMLDYFQSIHGADRVKFHAIAGPVSEPCATRQAMPGIRYNLMSRRTGGQFFNICLEDWQPLLQSLGLNVFVPIDSWQLTQAASPASIVVTVDGVTVPYSQTQGFTFDAPTNKIAFHGTAVPGPGQEIEVQYVGNCRP